MKQKNISNYLQMKVRRYIEYIHNEEKFGSLRRVNLVNALPKTLKEDMFIEAYSEVIKKKKIFQKFSSSFINELSQKIIEMKYGSEEIISKVKNSIFL